jgi:hypothetical protein
MIILPFNPHVHPAAFPLPYRQRKKPIRQIRPRTLEDKTGTKEEMR